MTVGERIREIRKRQRLSQNDLADRLGVTHQMVSKIEKCGDHMNIATLKKFAKALNTDISEFLD